MRRTYWELSDLGSLSAPILQGPKVRLVQFPLPKLRAPYPHGSLRPIPKLIELVFVVSRQFQHARRVMPFNPAHMMPRFIREIRDNVVAATIAVATVRFLRFPNRIHEEITAEHLLFAR